MGIQKWESVVCTERSRRCWVVVPLENGVFFKFLKLAPVCAPFPVPGGGYYVFCLHSASSLFLVCCPDFCLFFA